MIEEVVAYSRPKSPIAEAYRSIRTSIQFANVDGDVKTIMFTSASAGEGKSTTLSNVAITLADTGKKVMIVDCDLRKPKVHKIFEISNAAGLTDILLTGEDYKLYTSSHLYPNLSVVPSGKVPKNPSELLYSDAMKKFINKLKEDYDYIFIDAPPVLPVTDSVIMSAYIDGVVLVCASGHIDVEGAQRAKTSLEKANANILGVVLNKIPIKQQKYSSYYYYYSNEKDE